MLFAVDQSPLNTDRLPMLNHTLRSHPHLLAHVTHLLTVLMLTQGQCGYGTSIDVLAQQRREEWAIGANIGRMAPSLSSSSVGMDGNGNSSEHASKRSQYSAWFSGKALKPFIKRGRRQADIDEANR